MDSETINKAYLAGLKLKNSGLDEEIIYARLEKQGFPADLSRKVAKDVITENEKESLKDELNYGLVIAVIGFLIATVSAFVYADRIIIPIGFIIGGLLCAYLARGKLRGN